ncbi:TetR/AcrR family transcriptional regulator [Paracnuella aquatica]|uniref:TetR/AcrR family transcriptional regulator n=1 Tax=Paracnuella aquatica TaxID=2268757 RepID=UPI000DEFD79D|nr:TetR/AcrR family transcriptional regulator [Paracnuella aquatica]RPD48841.1 TetR/AcrR family transcriptional regulator [Paracnuella aquatica]
MSHDKKRDAIIDAALRRFAHFGVAKTTMAEIGADLAISKASLYYYFPDKINLYAAVLKSIVDKSEREDGPAVDAEPDPAKAMELFLERRTEFIIKYYNILEFLRHKTGAPEELVPVFEDVKERELRRINAIVERGAAQGIFAINNPEDKARLLFECLEGLRHIHLERQSSFFPDKSKFQAILHREKEFSQIFLNGLAVRSSA